jgi:ergothioneine biosynthesis protein EgtB
MSAMPEPRGEQAEGLQAHAARPMAAPPTQFDGRFDAVRHTTARLCEGLSAEDCQLQSMDDASPIKWHLAHTTWFFETFVLEPGLPSYRTADPAYRVLFNSYYVGVGERHPRPQRGLLSRPSLDEVWAYRRQVEAGVHRLLAAGLAPELAALLELGLHHEQQHQELILTDLLHHFSANPLAPAYRKPHAPSPEPAGLPPRFIGFDGGLVDIGHDGRGFAFDNELPRHRVWLEPFELADRLVTQGDYLAFIEDGGYARPELWLSEGWDTCQRLRWQAPLYWQRDDAPGAWRRFTLHGLQPLRAAAPVCHLSFFEADAYARWAGARLPTEAEWEHAALAAGAAAWHAAGALLDDQAFEPQPVRGGAGGLRQLFGDCWEWTASAYLPYPGYRPAEGAVGEYNGKFMINQMVLRGGSCATPRSHLRASYRNFFPATARWQFSGLRLAR